MVDIPNTNEKAQIRITSLAHKFGVIQAEVVFFPYDFEFDDTYKPEWGNYDAFGRMDPIMTYKRTTRDITVSFNVVAESATTAKQNFDNLQILINCLYPQYNDFQDNLNELKQKSEGLKKITASSQAGPAALAPLQQEIQKTENQITNLQEISNFGVQVIQKSPLFQISFMNLLKNDEFVAAITNFKHKLKFDAADTSLSRDGKVISGEFNISMTFKVLHTHVPGSSLKLNYF